MDWEALNQSFPVNEKYVWLNNGGTTPASRFVLDLLEEYQQEYSRVGVLTETFAFSKVRDEITSLLSELVRCSGDQLALIHNTSEGMHFLAHDYPFQPGDEVLVLDQEYPSNYYPWESLASKGVGVCKIEPHSNSEKFLDEFARALSGNITLVSLSPCHWCTGWIAPLEAIGKLCRERNVPLVVDGAQGLGMLDLDVNKHGYSALVSPAWKWLLGPLGLGVMYLEPGFLERLDFSFKSTGSVDDGGAYLPYNDRLWPTVRRYEHSTPNYGDWIYFLASLRMLHEVGFAKVRERIYFLADYLRQGLASLGCQVVQAPEANGMVVFVKPGVPSARLHRQLMAGGIVGALRLNKIRWTPHVYLSEGQLDRALETVAAAD